MFSLCCGRYLNRDRRRINQTPIFAPLETLQRSREAWLTTMLGRNTIGRDDDRSLEVHHLGMEPDRKGIDVFCGRREAVLAKVLNLNPRALKRAAASFGRVVKPRLARRSGADLSLLDEMVDRDRSGRVFLDADPTIVRDSAWRKGYPLVFGSSTS